MTNENNDVVLSATVQHVIEQFAVAMRTDTEIPPDGINRLEKLLSKGTVPKPDEINKTLFESPGDDKT